MRTPGLIYKKMSEVMKDIGPVSKDQKNTVQGFKFRGIDQFVNALHPALVKAGVFMAPECTSESHELREVKRSSGKDGVDKLVSVQMKYHFWAEDGSSVTIGPIPAEGVDSGDKATNKALSAALKYALIQTFSVPTEDMAEADLESPELGKTKKVSPSKEELSLKASVVANTEEGHVAIPVGTGPGLEPQKQGNSFRPPKKVANGTTPTVTATAEPGWE